MPEIIAGSAAYPDPSPRPVLTVGNFDGLHRGHRHLLAQLVTMAQERGVPSAVYTFEPPPRVVLAPTQHQPRILPWPDKVRLLGEVGIEQVIVERFTRAFAQHPPEWFAREVLQRRIAPQALLLGYDFRFGRARQGDIDGLRKLLPDMPIQQADELRIDGSVVSSSAIRSLVLSGAVDAAAQLLGRDHAIRGTVVEGDKRGRTIGFPTANLETDAQLLPARGVYAVRARADGGPWCPAVANLGNRPTFDGQRFLVEVHLMGTPGDLYGCELEVAFVQRLRGEEAFPDVAALQAQIRADVEAATALLDGES
jgi:riboflavin kinase/FMN adenylyltransferase